MISRVYTLYFGNDTDHLEPRPRWYQKSTRYLVLYPVENPPKVNRTVPYHAVEKRQKICINENTNALFMKAISLTPSISADSVDILLDSFNSKVKNVIDDIAPVNVSK